MPRPKEFDLVETLDAAMQQFWQAGYEATSVDELLTEMGIGRGSMYATFGDKRSLFLAALKHYGETRVRPISAVLNAPGSPLRNIRRLVTKWQGMAKKRLGCLAVNTAVELAPHDDEIAKAARSLMKILEDAFLQALNQAVEVGELPNTTDTVALSRYLVNLGNGVVVMSKAGYSQARIAEVVKVGLSVLPD